MKSETKYPIEVDWSKYTFRCSLIGTLMPGPRAKPGQIQATEATELLKIHNREVWGVTEDVHSKEMDKGTIQESEGIKLMTSIYYPGQYIPKNTERFNNGFIEGEPDVCVDQNSIVHDIKCPWSLRTFRQSEMTKSYEWQLRGYMWLKKYNLAQLDYTLVDAPEHLILDEVKRRAYYEGFIDETSSEFAPIEAQIRHNMTFGYIPIVKRLKSFPISREKEKEEQLMERIHLWRQTLKNMDI